MENMRLKTRHISRETNTMNGINGMSSTFSLQDIARGSLSPELKPLSPITISITKTNISLHNEQRYMYPTSCREGSQHNII
eukprot:UN09128